MEGVPESGEAQRVHNEEDFVPHEALECNDIDVMHKALEEQHRYRRPVGGTG